MRYGSIGDLEYEVPQSRLYCLCINVALCSTALQCICRVIRRSSMTMKAHTYYIFFGRPPIGGKLPPFPPPPGGATVLRRPRLRALRSSVRLFTTARPRGTMTRPSVSRTGWLALIRSANCPFRSIPFHSIPYTASASHSTPAHRRQRRRG